MDDYGLDGIDARWIEKLPYLNDGSQVLVNVEGRRAGESRLYGCDPSIYSGLDFL